MQKTRFVRTNPSRSYRLMPMPMLLLSSSLLCMAGYADGPRNDEVLVYEGPGTVHMFFPGRLGFWPGELGPMHTISFKLNWPKEKRAEFRNRDEFALLKPELSGDLRVRFDLENQVLSWWARDSRTGVEASGSYPNSYCRLTDDALSRATMENFFEYLREGVDPRRRWREVQAQLRKHPQRAAEVLDLIGESYLREFLEKYNLTDEQKATARSIVREYQERAAGVLRGSLNGDGSFQNGLQQKVVSETKAIFEGATSRLEALPTAAQRKAAEEREKKKDGV